MLALAAIGGQQVDRCGGRLSSLITQCRCDRGRRGKYRQQVTGPGGLVPGPRWQPISGCTAQVEVRSTSRRRTVDPLGRRHRPGEHQPLDLLDVRAPARRPRRAVSCPTHLVQHRPQHRRRYRPRSSFGRRSSRSRAPCTLAGDALPDGDHEVGRDEQVDLAEVDPHSCRRTGLVRDHQVPPSERAPPSSAVELLDVLHGQLVQPELLPYGGQLLRRRLESSRSQTNPPSRRRAAASSNVIGASCSAPHRPGSARSR